MLHKVRMHFTDATSAACTLEAVHSTTTTNPPQSRASTRVSPWAIGAAATAVAPCVLEPFLPAPLVPALEIAGTLATATIAACAATHAAGARTWSDRIALLRDVLPHTPHDVGGSALGALRFAVGLESIGSGIARLARGRLPKMLGGMIARRAQNLVPGAGLVLQGVRAATSALDAIAFVTTLEALARRSVELAEARAALHPIDLAGACVPTVSVAA